VSDFVPAGHVAHFVRDLVREQLDLSAIIEAYSELRGYPPFDPVMMTALLLYSYSQGVYSSRRMARACEERLDFLAVTAMNRPDHRTIAKFRRRHLSALSGLFVQVLRLCQQAGMADLGHVALDGTKIKANASKRKAMSYERMLKAEPQLQAEVDAWLAAAERTDAAEDAALGEARGDEMPDWVADKTRRIAKIKEAKAALEAEAKVQAQAKARAAAEQALLKEQRKRKGRPAKPKAKPAPRPATKAEAEPEPTPQPKAQRNFTDPESRIMKGPDGFLQGYNAQAAVDAKAQIIVAHGLSDCSADSGQLAPMVKAIRANTGRSSPPTPATAPTPLCRPWTSRRSTPLSPPADNVMVSRPPTAARPARQAPGSRRCAPSCARTASTVPTGCANRRSSRSSVRSSRPAASVSSCCEATSRSPPNGRWSAPSITY
jgi:transposase